ncbi:hypothetical protein EB796_005793 [Bugula neritina]|uniref:Ig-like domain-containing protein n=1 Tax=Bugula neritina TaxID=10212 RepID=A0A7J7KEC9_BUGNE|nr:hypothetical protein EB796_005793 [Bugula neritina]
MVNLLIIFLVCATHTVFVNGQNIGKITELSEPVVAKVGGFAFVNCTVSSPQSIENNILVEWVFLNATDGGKSVSSDCTITESHNIIAGKKKYEIFCVDLDNNDKRYALRVNALSVPDNGLYQCRVRISSEQKPTDSMAVSLTVLSPPKIVKSSSDITVYGIINGTASMRCDGQGIPGPNVTYGRASGRPLPKGRYEVLTNKTTATSTTTVLKLYNLTKEDRGTYRCSADNNIRPPEDLFSRLIIEFKPSVSLVEPSYGSPTGENTQIMMWCRVDGYPRPSMTWYAMTSADTQRFKAGNLELDEKFYSNAKVILTDEKYQVEQKIMTVGSQSTMDSMFYSLSLQTVESVDMVYYVCRAMNTHGEDAQAVLLYRM